MIAAPPFPLLGLSGGIASGKSFVAGLLVTRGWALIDADALAREVVAPGTEGLEAVVTEFGPGILTPEAASTAPGWVPSCSPIRRSGSA